MMDHERECAGCIFVSLSKTRPRWYICIRGAPTYEIKIRNKNKTNGIDTVVICVCLVKDMAFLVGKVHLLEKLYYNLNIQKVELKC